MTDELVPDPDITRARTLPAEVVRDPAWHARIRDAVWAPAWHPVLVGKALPPGSAHPFVLLPEFLDEPLVVTRDDDGVLRVLSNVCTHRANVVVDAPGGCRALRCRYHGRRFGLDGRLQGMPEFEGARDFPGESDHLPVLSAAEWGPILWTTLEGRAPTAGWRAALDRWLGWLDPAALRLDLDGVRDYDVPAHWVLYLDNYLEGFHIPFVHADLNQEVRFPSYRTITEPWGTVQVVEARDEADALPVPPGFPGHGENWAAIYLWLFPGVMFNVYPWGISLNIVRPRGPERTEVSFYPLVADAARRGGGASADLHTVEMEDEAVVQTVQRGIRSRFYTRGRYSPSQEQGVHHFHRLLAQRLADAR